MNIELGVLSDGGVMLVSDKPLPDIISRVEYYRDQKLFMLIYEDTEIEEALMHYEVPDQMVDSVTRAPNIIIYSLFTNHEPIGYKVPLVQIGSVY